MHFLQKPSYFCPNVIATFLCNHLKDKSPGFFPMKKCIVADNATAECAKIFNVNELLNPK